MEKQIQFTVAELFEMENRGFLDYSLSLQRKEVWSNLIQSKLIRSGLNPNGSIPELYFVRIPNSDIIIVLDGKQRLTTIFHYLRDELSLNAKTPKLGEKDLGGLRYSELSDELRERLNQKVLRICEITDLTAEEIGELFCLLNSGSPLKNMEKLRAMLGENLKFVQEMANHEFIKDKVKLTDSMRLRYADQELCLHIIMLERNSGNIGFSGKEMNGFVEVASGYADFAENTKETITATLNYLNNAFKEPKYFLRKVHVPIIFFMAMDAIRQIISADDFALFVEDFYEKVENTSPYYLASQSGSASYPKVQTRLKAFKKAFKNSFK